MMMAIENEANTNQPPEGYLKWSEGSKKKRDKFKKSSEISKSITTKTTKLRTIQNDSETFFAYDGIDTYLLAQFNSQCKFYKRNKLIFKSRGISK